MSFVPFSISVPGTTANLGPGFDSVGMAMNKYLRVMVSPSDNISFHFKGRLLKPMPLDENLIYQAAVLLCEKHGTALPSFSAVIESELHLSKGMGSSAAAIAAGIELANELSGLNLTLKEKQWEACLLEGHPDNVVPAFSGGITISSFSEEELLTVQAPVSDVEMVLAVPNHIWNTSESRKAMPEQLDFVSAVHAGTTSSMLVAYLMKGDWKSAGAVMGKDLYHEPYRSPFIRDFDQMKKAAAAMGAYGGAISGAGPSVIFFTMPGTGRKIAAALAKRFSYYEFELALPDFTGIQVKKIGAANAGARVY
ncbi:homoserine kinase [Fictibacillus iocasae]|uniref:Homoserine kinase n=1 Tax=Fictibacillus iocasae TaxID=2715437 RepID=A0ABW2NJV5_9BACL